ncbi:MAG: LytR/AlgR family response regulator transcription factor [Flavobacteriaceae bacterium]
MKIRAIIIDDESHGRKALYRALSEHCHEVEILEMCETAEKGIKKIKELQPDLVFLDIQMPKLTGFDVLKALAPINFEIIFVTSFDQYAIKAIKFSALDYLLKPLDIDDLIEAVQRAKHQIGKENGSHRYLSVLNNINHSSGKIEQLAVPTLDGIDFYKVEDIIYCDADGHYTTLYLRGGRQELVSKTLKDFENLLSESGFFRVHNSSLINIRHIQKYVRGDGGYLVLTEDHHVTVSRRRKEAFLAKLNKV